MWLGTQPGQELSIDGARSLLRKIERHIDRNTPLGAGSLNVLDIYAEGSGHPVAEVAEWLGIDLAAATMADGRRLAQFYGARVGLKR